MLPIPKNLKEILIPKGGKNDEFKVFGELICTCGENEFEVNYVADLINGIVKVAELDGKFFLVIKGICKSCNNKYELFDKDFNGWNGFVCEGFGNNVVPRPKTQRWICKECNSFGHNLGMKFFSKGKQDFIKESEGEFHEEDWTEAYSWIILDLKCSNCGLLEKDWISYETM